jgi:hypothetical protein
MAQFKYTLPSGKKFTMNAPAGTTQAQANRIFYSQVAAGSLVGFAAGQSISGTTTQAVKFALSRLDRGTAGVDDRVILSIVNSLPRISSLPALINTPLENPISQADLANINFNNNYTPLPIGPINANQVQGLLAQIANFVDQPADVMTNDKGVGLYGLDCQQLEMSGYVKPGTYRQFIFDPSPLTSVLSAPGIWTGRNGISSVTSFLNNPASQSDAMTTLMSQSYNSLTASGTIIPPVTSSVTALAGQVYTQSGLQTVSQLSAATGISFSSSSISGLSLANTPISSLLSTSVTNVGSLASGALNSASNFTNLSAITNSLNNTVTGGVSALVTNASKFGTSAVNQWIGSSGINQIPGIGSVSSSITNSINGTIGGLTTDLTNNIRNLDVLGKASEFASGFSNPFTDLSNLGNFNLSSLTDNIPDVSQLTQLGSDLAGQVGGLATNIVGGLTNSLGGLASSLGDLAGNFTSGLGSLGNFASLSSFPGLGDLGSLGGLFGGGGDSLVSSTQVAAGYTNTVNRAAVDVAFVKILGNPKIPQPRFDYPSKNSISLNASADIAYAQTQLTSEQDTIQTLYSQPLASNGGFSSPEDAATAVAAANGEG